MAISSSYRLTPAVAAACSVTARCTFSDASSQGRHASGE